MIDVLHLITRLDPGGSAENTLLTCRHLVGRGWSVELATGPGLRRETARIEEEEPGPDAGDVEPGDDDRTAGGEAPREVPIVELPDLRRDPHPVADLWALAQIFRLLRRERPEILHTHSAKAGILGRWAAFLARVPHVVHTPHGHVLYGYHRGWKNRLYNLAEKLTAPITERLVALSGGELRESVEYGIGREDQWVVIHSGVHLDSVAPSEGAEGPRSSDPASRGASRPGRPGTAPTGSPDRTVAARPADSAGRRVDPPLTVGSVARLEPVKGIDLLVEAVALMADDTALPRFRVEVWGEGDERDALERRIARHGLGELVLLRGCPGTVPEFLRSLDVYTQPSRNEGMGRALVLAQAASLPVVATGVCGIPDVVRDDETGLLTAPEDPADLARALARLLRDDRLRRRLSTSARPWVTGVDDTGHPRFSVEAMVHRIEALYRELMA